MSGTRVVLTSCRIPVVRTCDDCGAVGPRSALPLSEPLPRKVAEDLRPYFFAEAFDGAFLRAGVAFFCDDCHPTGGKKVLSRLPVN